MASKEMIAAVAKEIAFAMNGTHASYNEATFARYDRGAEVALNAIAALPQGEDAGGVVKALRNIASCYAKSGDPVSARISEAQAAQIASLSAKVAEVERERDEARAYADLGCESADGGPHHVMTQGSYRFCGKCGITIRTPTLRERARKAEARASELQREVERLERENATAKEAIRSLGQGLGHARAALQQEGE